MRERILLAVNLDNVSINGDEIMNQDDNPLMNNIDDYGNDEEEGNLEEHGGWAGGR